MRMRVYDRAAQNLPADDDDGGGIMLHLSLATTTKAKVLRRLQFNLARMGSFCFHAAIATVDPVDKRNPPTYQEGQAMATARYGKGFGDAIDAACNGRGRGRSVPRRIEFVDHRGGAAVREVMRDVYGVADAVASSKEAYKNSVQYMAALFAFPAPGMRYVVHLDENVRVVPWPKPDGFRYESAPAHTRLARAGAFANMSWVARSVALLRASPRLAVVHLDRCSGFKEVRAHRRRLPLARIGNGREAFVRPSVVPAIPGVQNATAHFTTEAFVADIVKLRRLLPFGLVKITTAAASAGDDDARLTTTSTPSHEMHTERMLEAVFARSEMTHAFIDKNVVHACNG